MATPVLRDDGILVHIGPHKTGTTAIQGSLAAARRKLAAAGIRYPGPRLEHNLPAAAAIQRSLGWERRTLDRAVWTELAEQVRATGGRVVLSSEVFSEATPDAARQIVAELGAQRVQVVVTLRPLEELLPSSWQQYVKSGYRVRYDHWLESVLESRGARTVSPTFWRRNDHSALVRRWSDCVGPQHVIVVVVDSQHRRSLFDAFEGLLRLPPGTLTPDADSASNRSLTLPEVELLRAFNRRARHRISGADYYRFVKAGAVRSLVETRVPPPDEARVTTPAWAIRRAREFSAADVEAIGELDVTVVGDLHALAPTGPVPDEPFVKMVRSVDTGLAADFTASLLDASTRVMANAEYPGLRDRLLIRARRGLAGARRRTRQEHRVGATKLRDR